MKKIVVLAICMLAVFSSASTAFASDFIQLQEETPYIFKTDNGDPCEKVFVIKPIRTGTVFVLPSSADLRVYDENKRPISYERYAARNLKQPYNMYCFGGKKGHSYYVKAKLYLDPDDSSWWRSIGYYTEKRSFGGKSKSKAKKIKKFHKDYTCVIPADERKPQHFKFSTKKKKFKFSMYFSNCNGKIAYKITTKKGKSHSGYITDERTGKKDCVIKNNSNKKRTYYVKVYPKNKYASGSYSIQLFDCD